MTDPQIIALDRRLDGVERAVADARDEQRRGTSEILDALRGTLDKPGGVLARVESISGDVDYLKAKVAKQGKDVDAVMRSATLASWLTSVPEWARKPLLVVVAVVLGSGPTGVIMAKVGVTEEEVAAALVALEVERTQTEEELREAKIEAAVRTLEAYRDAGEVVGLE